MTLLDADHRFHERIDPHRRGSRLAELLLGGQDGLVNVLGVILGVAAASHEARIVLAAGLAAAFAESISMAAVAFTSTQATRAHYQAELERERRHVERVPHLEREEVRALYRAKGFEGELLERIVDQLTSDRDVWVAVMMAEEHQLAPLPPRAAYRAALVVGLSAIVGSLVPLAPYLFLPVRVATWIALPLTALTLFGAGAYKAFATVGHWLKSGFELAAIGMASAFVGYWVGTLFQP